MVLKHLLNRTGQLAKGVAHLGRLGKVASRRSFLNRERKKLVLKIGEEAVKLVQSGKIEHANMGRLVAQLDKIEELMEKQDYGGEAGVDFHSPQEVSAGKEYPNES